MQDMSPQSKLQNSQEAMLMVDISGRSGITGVFLTSMLAAFDVSFDFCEGDAVAYVVGYCLLFQLKCVELLLTIHNAQAQYISSCTQSQANLLCFFSLMQPGNKKIGKEYLLIHYA
jgi:hypothetical protein